MTVTCKISCQKYIRIRIKTKMILLNDGNLQDKLSKIHQNKDKADVDTTPTFKCTTSESRKSL